MNVAIAVSVLLIGGVTLPGLDEPIYVPDLTEQAAPAPPSQTEAPPPQQAPATPYTRPMPNGPTHHQQQQQPRMMPEAPTNPAAGFGSYPFTPPTASPGPAQSGSSSAAPMQNGSPTTGGLFLPPTASGQRGNSLMQPFGLLSPLSTSPASSYTPSFTPFSARLSPPPQAGYPMDFSYPGQSVPGDPLYTPEPAASPSNPTFTKPFSQYRAAPAVSPYMNLFRDDNSLNRVDNYNTLVKPQLDQRSANLQVGGAIRGLQRSSRSHGSAIRQLGTQPRAPQAPNQYFNNHQSYFPQ